MFAGIKRPNHLIELVTNSLSVLVFFLQVSLVTIDTGQVLAALVTVRVCATLTQRSTQMITSKLT